MLDAKFEEMLLAMDAPPGLPAEMRDFMRRCFFSGAVVARGLIVQGHDEQLYEELGIYTRDLCRRVAEMN